MGKGMAHYKFCRVIRMDKECRYDKICKDNKSIENNLEKQLKRFKSTLNTGGGHNNEEKSDE